MADHYPRAFIPDRAFSVVTSTLSSGSLTETVDGEEPSVKENLANFDPLLRFYTSGLDVANAITWNIEHLSTTDRPINAIASLFYRLSAQAVAVRLRSSTGAVEETVPIVQLDLSGIPSLRVDEATQTRDLRTIRYQIAQPRSFRTVVGFVQPGQVQQLGREIRGSLERRQNRSRVVDPYAPPIRQGEYSVFRYVALDAAAADQQLIEQWASLPILMFEIERGDWRMGSVAISGTERAGLRSDVDFTFTEILV